MKTESTSAIYSERGFAAERIVWLHERISGGSYPNSAHLREKFGISKTQSKRDIRMLKALGAPVAFNSARGGFEYTSDFELPAGISVAGDESTVSAIASAERDGGGVQLTIPYTARVRLPDRMSAVELGRFVKGRPKGGVYDCEFRNPDLFIGMLVAAAPGAEVISPEWLRTQLADRCAEMLLANTQSTI